MSKRKLKPLWKGKLPPAEFIPRLKKTYRFSRINAAAQRGCGNSNSLGVTVPTDTGVVHNGCNTEVSNVQKASSYGSKEE